MKRDTVVCLSASRERLARVTAMLADTASVARETSALADIPIKIVLVDFAGGIERGLRAVEELRRSVAQVQVVALAESKDPEVILKAMRAGACEFAVLKDDHDLEEIVRRLLRRASGEARGGTIVSVFPAKGGVGATTLAVNLAGALCATGGRVLLIDFDRQLGDVLAFLDMAPRHSIADIVQNLHRLDRELLLSSLARHASGPFVLAQSDSLDDGDGVGPAQIKELLELAGRHFDYVVCDGLRGFDEPSLTVLDASNRVELVLTQDVIALRNARRCLHLFQRLGYERDKVELVVSRFHAKSAIGLDSIGENLGCPVGAAISTDDDAALTAINRGVPLAMAAPRSRAVHDIAALAARLSGSGAKKARGIFGALARLVDRARPASETAVKQEGETIDVARRTPETT